MQLSIRLCAVLAVLGACAVDADEPEQSAVTQESGTRCPIFFCGDNAPTAGDGLLFDEFDLFGRPNYAGVKIASTRFHAYGGGTPEAGTLWIDVNTDELAVYTATTRYSGTDLIGTIITFQKPDTGESFEILISDVSQGGEHFLAGQPDKIPVYEMKTRGSDGKFSRYVCNHDAVPSDADWPSVLGHFALVYRGDKYDPDHKKLIASNDPSDGWSFLACAGSGAGKMHLFRHTWAGSFGWDGVQRYYTTPAQRTAFMKAVTADYCGTGAPQFTDTGTPITFTANQSFMPPIGPYTTPEAIWTENGAACLSVARRTRYGYPYGYPRADINLKCGRTIPKCESYWLHWTWYGYAQTANP